MDEPGSSKTHCYCNINEIEMYTIPCTVCKRHYHRTCLESGPPSSLAGDIYFKLTCKNCSESGNELVERIKLQWTLVIILTLFNLQLKGSGKCGYFRWREDICSFIDQHWIVFFGPERKKAATWHHTVAGSLSSNCKTYFLSGAEVLGEKGWWALKDFKLPTLDDLEAVASTNKSNRKVRSAATLDLMPIIEGTRRRPNVLESALELKAKRAATDAFEPVRKPKKRKTKTEDYQMKITLSKNVSDLGSNSDIFSQTSHSSSDAEISNCSTPFHVKMETDYFNDSNVNMSDMVNDTGAIAQWLNDENMTKQDLDFEIDVGPIDVEPSVPSDLSDVMIEDLLPNPINVKNIKSEKSFELDDANDSQSPQKTTVNQKKVLENQHSEIGRKRKVFVKQEEKVVEDLTIVESKYMPISIYEEQQLLIQLESLQPLSNIEARNLYRKLIVRKLKREHSIPIFNIDNFMRISQGLEPIEAATYSGSRNFGRQEILDRYQLSFQLYNDSSMRNVSFISRLMGLEDDELDSFVSPYTTRVLKPFIFRDYKTTSVKLKLLQEIIAHPHRNNPNWSPPPRYPIDYSYVRPQHIPAINALCHEFFWSGIDLSESLQYPDFSCVALYRKVVIGFAFMVPDVKCNEAYITFIFCHPDWRRCGVATFMLYHLIQTCMGKDITLHVSAKSSALLLYQKFGFKVEEYILDFYDKYLPATSKECRHALFMRLNR